tara:strand:- start:3533 stop:3745 length:213 start_codon:yes stop_codon:yes gene_type:complete
MGVIMDKDQGDFSPPITDAVKDVQGKLNTHEAVCAERWKETIERIKRLEWVMIASAGSVIVLLAGMLWKI